ncbi:ABC transporter substrate-binding protein [Thermodesulfobacteriota bacterium]
MNKTARLTAMLVFFILNAAAPAPAADRLAIVGSSTITDQAGRRIQVARPFTRFISLYGAHTENLFRLGLDREILGVSRHEAFPPRALEKPVFSYHDDAEKFLAARPDIVLIRPMIDGAYPQLIARLEKSGIAVVSLQPGTVEEMYRYWEILGMLAGRRSKARELTGCFKNAVDGFTGLTGNIAPKKRVYFEAVHRKMLTFAPRAMAIFTLEAAGGVNIAADARPVRGSNIAAYGKERILSRAAEIEVYLAQAGAMNRPTVSLIRDEPGFHIIKAVRESRIHIVDEKIVSRPTFRLLQGIHTIGTLLYPDAFGPAADEILKQANSCF